MFKYYDVLACLTLSISHVLKFSYILRECGTLTREVVLFVIEEMELRIVGIFYVESAYGRYVCVDEIVR